MKALQKALQKVEAKELVLKQPFDVPEKRINLLSKKDVIQILEEMEIDFINEKERIFDPLQHENMN